MVEVSHYLILSGLLFTLGVCGVVIRRNAIIVLMCIELMLNAANLTFAVFARQHNQLNGHVFVFLVMAVAAAEAAVGLALVLAMFRHRATVNLDQATLLKG